MLSPLSPFLVLTTLITPLTASPLPSASLSLTPRQPTPNPFDFLDLRASAIASSAHALTSRDRCAAALSDTGGLAFPNSRIDKKGAGHIECRQRLVFGSVPVGYAFSVIAVVVEGVLELERGSFVEGVEVGVGYLPSNSTTGSTLTATQTDSAKASAPYGRFGTGYDGVFNLTMNLDPGNSRTTRARTRCATAVEQPEMVLDVWISLAHEQIDVDDAQVHKGSVSDVSVGFVVMWEKCGS